MTDLQPLDLRLVPSALGAWGATLVAVAFGPRAGVVLAVVCVTTLTVIGGVRLVSGRDTDRPPAFPHITDRPPAFPHTSVVATVVTAGLCITAAFAVSAAMRVDTVIDGPVRTGAERGAYATFSGVVTDDPRAIVGSFADQVVVPVRVHRTTVRGSVVSGTASVTVFAPPPGWDSVTPGTPVTFRARLAVPDRPGLVAAIARATGPPTAGRPPAALSWADGVRAGLSRAGATALPDDEAGLLPGLVVGDRSGLSPDVLEDFTVAGMSHLTAVSGANFTFLVGTVVLLARLLALGPRTTALVAGTVLVGFVVVARPSPSVLRAAVMGILGLLALMTGRRRHVIPALCTAVVVLLAVDPGLAVSWGFALSVTATAALVVLAPMLAGIVRGRATDESARPHPVVEAVAVAAAAHLVTAPLVAAMAGTFSVYAVLANVLVAPVIGPVTVIGAGAAVIAPISAGAATFVAGIAWIPLWWTVEVAAWTASLPAASVATPAGSHGALVVGAVTAGVVVAALLVRRRQQGRRQSRTSGPAVSGERGTIER